MKIEEKNVKLKWYQSFLAELIGFVEPLLGLMFYWLLQTDENEVRRAYAAHFLLGAKGFVAVAIIMLIAIVVLLAIPVLIVNNA